MSARVRPDLRLYLVTDPVMGRDRPLASIVAAAVRGGATLVQLRDKSTSARALLNQALELKALLAAEGISLIVNDRVDVAAAAGVGCHVGQSDLPLAAARRILGPDALLGVSLDHPDQVREIDPSLVDYVAHGPFAPTGTKPDAGAAVGPAGLRATREATGLPLVAIGGIDAGNAAAAIESGADGIAVVSAIMTADEPEASAAELRTAVEGALTRNRMGTR